MKTLGKIGIALGIAALAVGISAATAHDNDRHGRREVIHAFLIGINETPAAISTPASGTLHAVIDEDSGTITYTLTYKDLTSAPLFSHIHFGARHTTGGVMVFLCGGGGQAACPPPPAEVTGTIMAANVVGPTGQGITAGQFDKVLAAIRSGTSYANVHTTNFPSGEIRGQVSDRD